MAENFLTYIELDPNSKIEVTSSKITFTNLYRGTDAYVYYDKGVDYFDGDFIHYLTVCLTGSEGETQSYVWGIANGVDDFHALGVAGGSWFAVYLYKGPTSQVIALQECDSGDVDVDQYAGIVVGTPYYLKIVRDESVGDHGRIYCYIYSDSARTNLVATLSSLIGTSKKDFRYIYAINAYGAASTPNLSGYVENLSMIADITPLVTTQACTNIGSTTATGNGHIVQLGSSAVTEHGHCWNTTGTPTVGNSETTNGAGSVGAFTSTITGLTPGTKYYVRAYATNTGGTSYGTGVSFVAGSGASQGRGGDIAVKETRLHYYGNDGIEYYIQGTAV